MESTVPGSDALEDFGVFPSQLRYNNDLLNLPQLQANVFSAVGAIW